MMNNPLTQYEIKITDLSEHNVRDVNNPPSLDIIAAKFNAGIFRVGYGRRKDRMFAHFWGAARGRMQRMNYWFNDYYSHRSDPILKKKNISDAEWGIEQGDNWFIFQNGSYGDGIDWIDLEEASESVGGWKINWTNRASFNTVARHCIERYDQLTGRINGVYCSLGFIDQLSSWAKWRPLWIAWYDRGLTKEQVIAACRKKGWTGPIIIWQFASDGDYDANGTGDGLTFGMGEKPQDLCVSFYTPEQWSAFMGSAPVIDIENPTNEDEIIVIEPIIGEEKSIRMAEVTSADGLNVRNKPWNLGGTILNGYWMPKGFKVELLDKAVIGNDIWYRIGRNQYCAGRYKGTTFLK